jgi:parallel beta-helix repeat protein
MARRSPSPPRVCFRRTSFPGGIPVVTLVLGVLPCSIAAQETISFTPGMVVTESVRIQPGSYAASGDPDTAVAQIVVRGDDIVLDLRDVTLTGTPLDADPDTRSGVAIRVDGGRGVTIRGGRIHGYRFGIFARGTRDLRILNSDLSHSWKPRLFSVVAHESLVDWLSYHANEEREWMRFGSSIYLEGVRGGEIRGNRAVQGMNALLMTYSDSLVVEGNTFSYNSGLGIGLYHSSANAILGNVLDYNVRGYSEGFYQRGQDSAAILLYAQSSNNVIAYNSATHSGDGFFLWAGQRTMETGEGGANDNLLFNNDFSWAPTNAVEITFSRNRVLANYLRGSRYGVWGGYSWDSEIRANCFGGNQFGVAIEHGQENVITNNRFDGDSLAISLWARESEPADWGYPLHRDTRSRDHRIDGNIFAATAELWRLERTSGHTFGTNEVLSAVPAKPCDPRALLGAEFDSIASRATGRPQAIPSSARSGLPRSAIIVDEWGPYDGATPKLWPADTVRTSVPLRVLGPRGSWRVVARHGVASLSSESGPMGDTLTVTPQAGNEGDWSVELEHSPPGDAAPTGSRRFSFDRFEPLSPWTVRFFRWDDPARDPQTADSFDSLFTSQPFLTRREDRLGYVWFRPPVPDIPPARWAVEATADVTLDPGVYSIRTISDDGVRLWVDDELVIDHLDPHGSVIDYAPLTGGYHRIRIRYYQIEGWVELRADVVRGSPRSTGSPGPH